MCVYFFPLFVSELEIAVMFVAWSKMYGQLHTEDTDFSSACVSC
jgi:hypothetical protein